ncbi:hypothetical protein EQG68_14615 [Flavobacterium piscinae]|uniref:SGNH/GDSL hydrolase family protein n=1 Tax=Flavobacterium piscinae TaxID=2506424 RepID=A0A4Q1KEW1_9FLAO|nr:hypothetical protein [Flavobacterium piscinae]RXR27733.1 hypothetical protein EQG68_14615 [Flavobacterium piscinae]
MKSFLLKCTAFIVLLLLVVVGIRTIIVRQKQNPNRYKLDASVEHIILGHSQPECGLNDSLIAHTKNFSQGGEAYFYTYTKLKKLIEVNPKIKTVYLSFSNNQLEQKMDEWTFDAVYINDKYPAYFFAMDWKEKKLLWKHNPKAVLQSEQLLLKNNLVDLVKYKGKIRPEIYWGDYLYLKRQKTDSLIQVNYVQTIVKERGKGISEINLTYLKKIVHWCKEHNIQLLFYRTPVHTVLSETYDEKAFDSIRKKHFSTVPFLDCIDFPLSNEEFGDFDHLNYKGARKFSSFFNQLVQQKITSEFEIKNILLSESQPEKTSSE